MDFKFKIKSFSKCSWLCKNQKDGKSKIDVVHLQKRPSASFMARNFSAASCQRFRGSFIGSTSNATWDDSERRKQSGHEYSWIRSLLQHFVWWKQSKKGGFFSEKVANLVTILRLALHRTPVSASLQHHSSLHWHITSLHITLHINCNFLCPYVSISPPNLKNMMPWILTCICIEICQYQR